ncbi:uncharacterized protein BJ212DRAFT_1361087 [Suillus subaureus]|uniref:Uncharacterized protein n=1 Tax=Suillus subaureus TaxID=48587 RepID=A0A9P7JCI8_9AGAM|nr:uncharacterized protein BJ212DRAFT_1361087 [Suillus subaureus]KAG1814642.1 hypothetical protein BJ212DRAFT_1361087 [Suillus subaureus]
MIRAQGKSPRIFVVYWACTVSIFYQPARALGYVYDRRCQMTVATDRSHWFCGSCLSSRRPFGLQQYRSSES